MSWRLKAQTVDTATLRRLGEKHLNFAETYVIVPQEEWQELRDAARRAERDRSALADLLDEIGE